MFGALEKRFEKDEHHDLINDLYRGVMKDYVKCLEVIYYQASNNQILFSGETVEGKSFHRFHRLKATLRSFLYEILSMSLPPEWTKTTLDRQCQAQGASGWW